MVQKEKQKRTMKFCFKKLSNTIVPVGENYGIVSI